MPFKPVFPQNTALHYAAALGNDIVVQALLAAGADPTRKNDDSAFDFCFHLQPFCATILYV
jgi:ankyrin repeat protein